MSDAFLSSVRSIRLALPGGGETEVRVRRSSRARHMLIHVDVIDAAAELVLPRYATLDEGIDFAHSKRRWISARLKETPPAVPFAHGARIPVLGETLRLCHADELFPDIWQSKNQLIVSCPETELSDQVFAWLWTRAAKEIRTRARDKASQIGRNINGIKIHDPQSMWGSCTAKGSLTLSWRLVMAPEKVLDYVVAHEVSHLIELNHSRRFWGIVDELCEDVKDCRAWLRSDGPALHRYGVGERSHQVP